MTISCSCPYLITRGHHATPTHLCAGQTSSGKIPARVKFRLTRRWPDAIRGLAKGQDERRGATLFLAALPPCRLAALPPCRGSTAPPSGLAALPPCRLAVSQLERSYGNVHNVDDPGLSR